MVQSRINSSSIACPIVVQASTDVATSRYLSLHLATQDLIIDAILSLDTTRIAVGRHGKQRIAGKGTTKGRRVWKAYSHDIREPRNEHPHKRTYCIDSLSRSQ